MKLASVMVAIAGEIGNTVPKYDVTPAEVAVLTFIHGNDAVFDIDVTGETKRSHREERNRLIEAYAQAQPDGTRRSRAVDALFPGAAARVFEDFEELEEIDDSQFKNERRSLPKGKAKANALDHDGDGQKGGAVPNDDKALPEMTKAELVAAAAERGVEIDARANKAEILAALEAAPADEANEAEQDDGIGEMNDQNMFS